MSQIVFENATVFDGESAEFIAFDSYTNHRTWRRGKCGPVEIEPGQVCLLLAEPGAETHVDLGVEPIYTYSSTQGRLEIKLQDAGEDRTQFHRVSDRLVTGLCDGLLVSLTLEGTQIRA